MALDPSARLANIKDSWKKYLYDNLETGEGIKLLFDRSINDPDIVNDKRTLRWIVSRTGPMDIGGMSTGEFEMWLATRKDPEGYRLAQLRDTVMGYLTTEDETDGMRRIPFYRSYASQAWTSLGSMLVQNVAESAEMEAEDGTKYLILTVTLRFGSKV